MRSCIAFLKSVLVLASVFFGAWAHASTTASYYCETVDHRSKIFVDFMIDFQGEEQSLRQITSHELTRETYDQVTVFDPSVLHFEQQETTDFGTLHIRGETSLPGGKLRMTLEASTMRAGPETPWPLMYGWMQIRSPRGYQARQVSCFLSSYWN